VLRHALLAVVLIGGASADDRVLNSKHDLSVFGPGPVRATHEDQVCIFCHTPHNASPAAPLWNRYNPRTYYRIYSSSTTNARIDQPGPSSKMCLSCHDGSIALGMVLSRSQTDPIQTNWPFIPSQSDLTNDLSDDHPIGFRYDRQLSNRDPQIRNPDLVSRDIELGSRGEVECTACHNPHNNENGNFLRITQREGALCVTCHRMRGWRNAAHAQSGASVPATVTNGERLPFRSMRDNACLSCHKTHSAPQRERLLRARSTELCLGCHDGLTATNILSVQNERSGHRFDRLLNTHDPAENPLNMRDHVDCADCHNPHAARTNPLANSRRLDRNLTPAVPPAMQDAPGVSLAGLPIARARTYQEVCFRCHADNPVRVAGRIVRQRGSNGNIRRLFLPTAASSHPVAFARADRGETPSLLPELRSRALIGCQDCHNNPDARGLGGGGPNGPHGSRFDFLLADRYETKDFTVESAQSYALCYGCHDRNSILGDESFSLHRNHVVRGRTPCSACHSPHGVNGNRVKHDHLINFDVSIVSGARSYRDTGRFSGSCTLTCHGVRHVNFSYPLGP